MHDDAMLRGLHLSEATVAKDGNVFAVTLRDGSLPAARPHPLGVYRDDCRHLSGHELTLSGARLELLAVAPVAGPEAIHELTNPELRLGTGRVVAAHTVRVRLVRRLDAAGAMHERIEVAYHGGGPVRLDLGVRLRADFAPVFAVRGIVDLPDPSAWSAEATADGITFRARGRDGVTRATTVTGDPAPAPAPVAPAAGAAADLRFPLRLRAGHPVAVTLTYRLDAGESAGRSPAAARTALAGVHLDDSLAQRVADRALDDLRMLESTLDGRRYFAAGVPWYATLFGRDSLLCALQVLPFAPGVAADTLELLAARLGTRPDPVHEEEPGKVLHELRVGEVAGARLSPLARYHGSVDATPLWLCLLCEHAEWTGDLALFRALEPRWRAMLAWIDGAGDADGDGLLDYAARAAGGLRNHGWKDSEDGICHEDGTWLEPPIALVEAQAYVVRAKRGLSRLHALDGDDAAARRLAAQAQRLEARLERFWLADRGHYAMALGGDGAPSRALASNQGHLLWARAVTAQRAGAVRDALVGPRSFSGWGIRTLADGQDAFNPLGYHLGTVWPHDTAMAAAGLREYGFDDDFLTLLDALLDAAAASPEQRLPELFAGFERDRTETPVPYPVACRPQAWAAGAVPQLLISALGLVPDGFSNRLVVRRPLLPRDVTRARVTGLQVAGSRVDLRFERDAAGRVRLAGVDTDGDVGVEPPAAG